MGKKQYWNSEAKNKRGIKEGRSHRVFGHLTQPAHHLLSDLGIATFLLLQWRSTTTDIREQFPLDRMVTNPSPRGY